MRLLEGISGMIDVFVFFQVAALKFGSLRHEAISVLPTTQLAAFSALEAVVVLAFVAIGLAVIWLGILLLAALFPKG